MGQLLSLSIDLTKVKKEWLQTTDKNGQPYKNDAKYLNLTVSINDTPNQFGQDVSAWLSQTQEERNAGNAKNYLGNGKVFFGKAQSVDAVPVNTTSASNDNDGLPF